MDYGQPEYSRKKVGNWAKFSLLMWKNMILIWRRKYASLFEILTPVFFALLLVLIRGIQMPKSYDVHHYNEVDPIFNAEWNKTHSPVHYTLAYTPRNPALDALMQQVKLSMEITDDLIPKDTEEELNNDLIIDQGRLVLAGLIFDGITSDTTTLPNDLSVRIRFPAESRALPNRKPLSNNWQTDSLFPLFSTGGPRNQFADDGGNPPGYVAERFMTVQAAISKAFIEIRENPTEGQDSILKPIRLMRFSDPATIVDGLLFILQLFVPLVMFLGFLYPAINNVKMITVEKEKQLKEAMKIMGLPSGLHWLAWFVKIMLFQIITISLMVVLLKVSWYPDTHVSVFTNTDWSALWVFMLCYSISITTFCFMMSVLFSKANTAATITGLLWFIFSAPYSFLQPNYANLTLAAKMLTCLFHNSGMSFGFLLIFTHEGNGEGLQWSNFWTPTSIEDDFTVGHVTIMLLVASLLYLLIALYVEQIFPGDFGVPQKWYFPLEKLFCCSKNAVMNVEGVNTRVNNENFEADPQGKTAGIRTQGLRKVYSNKKVAVQGLSMSMYDDEITVLLGDNGAGKTTTMSMLTGMFPPSAGTATINGSDVRTNIDGVRESIGLCPQHNILFDELTVREHIIFFSKLKGLSSADAEIEARKYVKLLELVPKTNSQSKTLSGGMKRKLSVGVALCGGSRVVLCDEPTSGMDPAARRALWDLLQLEKRGRTILLSTHFMDEADVLGDRIAIMHQGELKCYGSSFFLKKAFGTGYELVCEKGYDCDVNATTRLIQEYIPDTNVSSNVGSELSYKMDSKYSRYFQPMLKSLEENSQRLDINGYGISQTTLEEVFLKVTSGKMKSVHGQSTLSRLSEKRYTEAAEKMSSMSMNSVQTESLEQLRGGNFLWSQLKAMILKKTLYTWRNWVLFIVQVIIPVILTVITVMIARTFSVRETLRELTIELDSYTNNPIVLISDEQTTGVQGAFLDAYEAMFYDPPTERTHIFIQGKTIPDFVTSLHSQDMITFNSRTLAGVTVNDSSIVAWYNNQPYHTIPLTLNLVYNALLKTFCTDCSISITNSPLPFTFVSRLQMLQAGNNMGFQLASNVGFSMAFVAAFYIIFYIKERVSRAKLLQFVSGINIWTFWLTAFVWDLITFVVTICFMVATLAVFQEDGWSTGDEMGRVMVLSLCFVWAVLPFVYLFSMLFEVPSSGFIKTVMVGIFLGIAVFYTTYSLSILDFENIADGVNWAFLIVPHYALIGGLGNLNTMNTIVSGCTSACNADPFCTTPYDLCGVAPFGDGCCNTEFLSWEDPGILKNVIFMVAAGVLFMGLLFMIEFRVFHGIFYKCKSKPNGLKDLASNTSATDVNAMDSDVVEEKYRVRNMNYNQVRSNNLVVRNMTKFYNDFLAVDQICVAVDAGECFGLLGVNGAGKTSTFKMLTGDETISSGEAWVRGVSLKTDMEEIYKNIGYCPQFDALLEDLTGRETLKIFALLRGIHPDHIDRISNKLATDFNYTQHIDKKVKEYSGGNKRKLSTSLALLGNPSVVYLDEPTTGMDPGAKRLLWEVMSKYRASGKSIILTSHSMEECEALCTRLSIMVNGEFKCLGSAQHLKNKFSNGYLLIVQMNRQANSIGGQWIDPRAEMERVKRFVESKLPGAVLKEEYQGRMSYFIPTGGMKWSTMFGIMETGKEQFNIESYSLSQTSLEQVFLSFTKYQRDEGAARS